MLIEICEIGISIIANYSNKPKELLYIFMKNFEATRVVRKSITT